MAAFLADVRIAISRLFDYNKYNLQERRYLTWDSIFME